MEKKVFVVLVVMSFLATMSMLALAGGGGDEMFGQCGESYYPKSWEWQFIEAAQAEGKLPVFWYVYHADGSLKVKIDYFDSETGLCYTVWCQYDLPYPQLAISAVRQAGFTADDGIRVKDGGKYRTELAGRVKDWLPGLVFVK